MIGRKGAAKVGGAAGNITTKKRESVSESKAQKEERCRESAERLKEE